MKRVPWLCVTLLLLAVLAGAEDLPPGWGSLVLDHADRLPAALGTPPAALLRSDFSQFKVSLAKDVKISGSSLQWQFTASRAEAQASLILTGPPLCDGFAVWVKNPGEAALDLSVRLTDAGGATWRSPAAPLGDHKGWWQYVFKLSDFKGPAAGYPAAPYQTLELVISALQAQKPYQLYLDDLQTLSAPPPSLSLTGLVAPHGASAGDSVPLRLAAQFTGQGGRPVEVSARLARGATPVSLCSATITPDPQQAQSLSLALPIPAHLAAGTYRLSFSCPAADLSAGPEQEITVSAPPPFTKTGVNSPMKGGCLTVDGLSLPIIGGWLTANHMPRRAPWVMVPCTADFDPTGVSAPVWLAPEKFSYAELDARLAAVLAANPHAYLIPVITLSSPPWWDQAHPKELMIFGDGQTTLPAGVPGAKRTRASWASVVWRKDAAAALSRLLLHLEQSPFAPAIIGYQLASGEDGRWAYPGTSQGVFADYSHPQQEAFRTWLQGKYKSVQALRQAWGQPARPVNNPEALKEIKPILGFNQARIPDQIQRLRGPSGVLHDPNAAQEVVDYQIFCSDEVADTIRFFAMAAREAASPRRLLGAAYGHLFDLAATRYGVQNGGHLALAPICQAPELDFLTSNATFGEPGAPPLVTTASSSITSHGKAWVTLARANQSAAGLVNGVGGGGLVALEGYTPEALPTGLRTLPPGLDRGSAAEIAVIIDDISAAYTSCGPELVKPLLSDQRVSLSLMGAPFDVWTLDDLMEGRAAGYKLYVFLDCFYLDGQWRKQLVSLLGQQPCTALWIYAPGAIDQNIGGRTMKDLTGLTLVPWVQRHQGDTEAPARAEKGFLQVRVGGDGGYLYGSPAALTPRFICVDDKADVRGTLAGTNFGGLAVKDNGSMKSVWSAAPHLPASLLRSIAVDADVHMYTDEGDGVYLNKSIVAVRAAADGEHTIRFPRLGQLYDLADGKPVGKQANQFRVNLKAGQIGLYYYGTAPLADR